MLLKKSLEQKVNTYIYSHVYSTVCSKWCSFRSSSAYLVNATESQKQPLLEKAEKTTERRR